MTTVPASTSALARVARDMSASARLVASASERMTAQRSLAAALVEQSGGWRVMEAATARTRRMLDALAAEARREIAQQYRRVLLARAVEARHAEDRRAALARRALTVAGPTLTYLLALDADPDALAVLRERADSDPFAAEVLAAVEAVEQAHRSLALTVWAVSVALAYLAAVAALAARWTEPPTRTPALLRYSLDRTAPPASAQRSVRPSVSANREATASTSTPVQEYRRQQT